MKTLCRSRIASVILVSAGLLPAGFAAPTAKTEAVQAPSQATVSIVVTANTAAPPGPAASAPTPGSAPSHWDDIKDCSSAMRDQFFAGLQQLKATVDKQFNELTAKRAALHEASAIRDWDSTLNEMNSARFFLAAMGEKLRTAVPENWEQQKAKVGLAWIKSQDVYARAKGHSNG